MAEFDKTVGTTVLALQIVSANVVVLSSPIDVSTDLAGRFDIHFARKVATALSSRVRFRIEGSAKSSGDGFWSPLAAVHTGTAMCTRRAMTGTAGAGTRVLPQTNTSGFDLIDTAIFLEHTTLANSEWHRTKAISTNVSVTIEDLLTNEQTSSTQMSNLAQMWDVALDLSAVKRLRLAMDASQSGQSTIAEAFYTATTALG